MFFFDSWKVAFHPILPSSIRMVIGALRDPKWQWFRQEEGLELQPRTAMVALQSPGTQAPIILLPTPLLCYFLPVIPKGCLRSSHQQKPVSRSFLKEVVAILCSSHIPLTKTELQGSPGNGVGEPWDLLNTILLSEEETEFRDSYPYPTPPPHPILVSGWGGDFGGICWWRGKLEHIHFEDISCGQPSDHTWSKVGFFHFGTLTFSLEWKQFAKRGRWIGVGEGEKADELVREEMGPGSAEHRHLWPQAPLVKSEQQWPGWPGTATRCYEGFGLRCLTDLSFLFHIGKVILHKMVVRLF